MCVSPAIGPESASDDHTLLMAERISHDIGTVVQQESNTPASYTTETFIRWESTVEFDTCHTHTRSTKCVLANGKTRPCSWLPAAEAPSMSSVQEQRRSGSVLQLDVLQHARALYDLLPRVVVAKLQ